MSKPKEKNETGDELEGAKDYRDTPKNIEIHKNGNRGLDGKSMSGSGSCFRKNNSEKAYQLGKDLTTEKLGNNLQPYKTSQDSATLRSLKY